jgi:hypothetical protein
MRRILEAVSLLLLVLVWAGTARAVFGSDPVPARIPIHFDAAGQPDGWATRGMLWLQPAIAAGIHLLMTLVARFAATFNFGRGVGQGARRALEKGALGMISWLKVEILMLLAWIQYQTIEFARRGQGRLSPVFIPVMMVIVFGTIAWHTVAMRRLGRG